MKSTSALEEFLQICEQDHMDGSGHSIVVLSPSEMNGSLEIDTPSSVDVLQTEAVPCSEGRTHSGSTISGMGCLKSSDDKRVIGDRTQRMKPNVDRQAINDVSVTENVVEETPPEEYNNPAAHSTPNPGDDDIGFWINPDEMPDHLKAATIRVARQYLMK